MHLPHQQSIKPILSFFIIYQNQMLQLIIKLKRMIQTFAKRSLQRKHVSFLYPSSSNISVFGRSCSSLVKLISAPRSSVRGRFYPQVSIDQRLRAQTPVLAPLSTHWEIYSIYNCGERGKSNDADVWYVALDERDPRDLI